MPSPSPRIRAVAFLGALAFNFGIHQFYAENRMHEIYFQPWTSESLMQTLPLQKLREAPLQALWYLHKQPPLLDAIRASVAQFVPENYNSEAALKLVDLTLLYLWRFASAAISTLIFVWLWRWRGAREAWLGWLIWTLHPSNIFYSDLLDTTLLSAWGVTWLLYELWLWSRKAPEASSGRLATSLVFVFYARTVFQWYFFIPFILILGWLKIPKASQRNILLTSVLLISPWLIRQKILFDTFNTTTFAGYHYVEMLGIKIPSADLSKIKSTITYRYPAQASLYTGSFRYNTEAQAINNLAYQTFVQRWIAQHPAEWLNRIGQSYIYNERNYWRPSFSYTDHRITDHLFYIPFYRVLFSGLGLIALLLYASLMWLWRSRRKTGRWKSAAVLIPVAYVYLVTHFVNRYEWCEAYRMKFFLEPVFMIWIIGNLIPLGISRSARGLSTTTAQGLQMGMI